MKVTLTATSFYDATFRQAKTVEIDDEEWAELDENERNNYVGDLEDEWRRDLLDVDWKVED